MIIFLYGENSFLIKEKVKELRQKFNEKVDESGQSSEFLDGENINLAKLNQKINENSLFSPKKMITVENIFLNKQKDILKNLTEILKNKKNENVVIFADSKIKNQKKGKTEKIVIITAKEETALNKEQKDFFGYLSKQKFVQEFKNLNNFELNDWIKKICKQKNSQISNQAISTLIGLIGNDLNQLKNELNKLISYKYDFQEKKSNIDSQDVLLLSKGKFDDNIFNLTDKISQNNKSQSLKILEEQINGGISENYILTMLIRQFKIILRVKECLDKNIDTPQIAGKLKIHPFVAQKSITQSRNFNKEKIKQILNSLIDADLKQKTGKTNLKTSLDLVFVK